MTVTVRAGTASDFATRYGPHAVTPLPGLSRCEWSDNGFTQTASLDLAGVTPFDPDITDFVVETADATYGPYGVDSYDTSGEAQEHGSVQGSLAPNLEYVITNQEDGLYDAMQTAVTALVAQVPYARWLGKRGAVTGLPNAAALVASIMAQLVRASSPSEIKRSLEQWGITIRPYGVSATSVGIAILPLYPIPGGVYASDQLHPGIGKQVAATAALELVDVSTVKYATPDRLNTAGRYLVRRVESSFRTTRDPDLPEAGAVFYRSGTGLPSHYLPGNVAGYQALIADDLQRWKWQFTSRMLTLTQRHVEAYIAPRQTVTYNGDEWLVTDVNHTWSATDGYSRDLVLALKQGPQAILEPTVEA